ncbi:MAG: sodium-dependent transporter [Opitutae bacterium]|nr:sodium-dependent transporter [Opitutae bacterium]
MSPSKEAWGSRMGVILAVAGSAVGLGNFLRFPGLAAQYGGGAFMIAYFTALLLIGIPIGWAEWTMGRSGGVRGYHSAPGIFHVVMQSPAGKYLGLLGFIIPVMVYMYYVYVEAWCLGYAYLAATGRLAAGANFGGIFAAYTGLAQDGSAVHFGLESVGLWLVLCYALNFFFIYRGISKGIELACKWGMPLLILIALIILGRVLTLGTPDPLKPDQNVLNGLGFMWNPKEVWAGLKNAEMWLAASGQIFFTLTVGFGAICCYASYLKKKDDVVLSALTAAAANEFCEVGLGGLITVPAAFVFLGTAGIVGMGTFGLGFNVLPAVFAQMPYGNFFAFGFFALLFLAAVTSSLSMLQPGVAFMEEGLGLARKPALALLGIVTAFGSMICWWFSKDLKALDTIDFWVGNVMIYLQGFILILVFSWSKGMGIERGWREAHEGAAVRIPRIFKFIMKWVSPVFLSIVLLMFVLSNVFGWNFSFADPRFAPTGRITDLVGDKHSDVARLTVAFVIVGLGFSALLMHLAGKRWTANPPEKQT